MTSEDEFAERFHRDRREHGGAADRLDDDRLARLTEEERVAAGLDAYDPDEVPPATMRRRTPTITQSDEYREERAEVRQEVEEGEAAPGHRRRPVPAHALRPVVGVPLSTVSNSAAARLAVPTARLPVLTRPRMAIPAPRPSTIHHTPCSAPVNRAPPRATDDPTDRS